MVFLAGPRQVGKTTLSMQLLKTDDLDHPAYLNWDDVSCKKKIIEGYLPSEEKLIIFDEIHKYLRWRNLIKGHYDRYKLKKQFLITGSARLDYYRRGGDSMQGRYHLYHLHPLSLYEINKNPTKSDLDNLLQFGGFPEPFIKSNKRHWKRWQNERVSRVIQEDLINLEKVKEISQLDLLLNILPSKVGAVLSLNSLREDLNVKFETVDRWINIFERLYLCYRISPYGLKTLRTAKKEKKLYLWDWSLIESEGVRFENLVASNLLKYCQFHYEVNGDKYELCFLRDSEKREIDFVIIKDKKPLFAVECKSSEREVSSNIKYFCSRTEIPIFYQVHLGKDDYEVARFKTRIIPFAKFVQILKI
ncbi:MAG: ATP-binding protein [Oligoflexia bacterium]|nr:ATP-binding protein [Oligoflexia bacterium]